jgi:hypothetical protein
MVRRLMNHRLLVLLGLAVVAIAAVVVVVATSGGGGEDKLANVEDPDPKFPAFRVGVGTDSFAGPAPLEVHFKAKPFDASGKVLYQWVFDDGYASHEQNPTHKFVKPGYYLVGVTGRDSKGEEFTNSLYLGIWPPEVWTRGREGKVNPLAEAAKQRQRTRLRKRELAKQCERSADCRRRTKLAEKFEKDRRRALREKCLKDPKCREASRKAARQNRAQARRERQAANALPDTSR